MGSSGGYSVDVPGCTCAIHIAQEARLKSRAELCVFVCVCFACRHKAEASHGGSSAL